MFYINRKSLQSMCVCVCVCQTAFGLCWPISDTAAELFQQFGAGNSCGEQAEAVCTQPFEGYSAL